MSIVKEKGLTAQEGLGLPLEEDTLACVLGVVDDVAVFELQDGIPFFTLFDRPQAADVLPVKFDVVVDEQELSELREGCCIALCEVFDTVSSVRERRVVGGETGHEQVVELHFILLVRHNCHYTIGAQQLRNND